MIDKPPVFAASIAIRWGDMDAFGHVNNTEYFRYMEQARIEWFNHLFGTLDANGCGPVLVNAQCNFLRQLRYPGTVEVRVFVDAVGRSSIDTRYQLSVTDQPDLLVAEGTAKVVWINFEAEKSTPLPDAIRARLPVL
jgi:acyl-CoA thioester hydrolase